MSRRNGRRRLASGALVLGAIFAGSAGLDARQEPSAPQPVKAGELQAAIDVLGDLDYGIRTAASRTVRRTPGAQAVPALIHAVSEHPDGYVRYRALVLLTGFNDPRARDIVRESLASPNDRLRSVAYAYFEHLPDARVVPDLRAALDRETSEFVRPALVRALAAAAAAGSAVVSATEAAGLQRLLVAEADRGQDFFRSAVIEALGDYKAAYALDALVDIAKLEGPLQDDAAVALGKIGDRRALTALALLQRNAAREAQPYVAAAICLLGVNCEAHRAFLIETLRFADRNPGYQPRLRAAAGALADLAIAGDREAAQALFDIGVASRDPTRAPVTLAIATIALRATPLLMAMLQTYPDQAEALALLGEGFDMLEEDYEKERCFAFVRRTYWEAPEGSPVRGLAQALIGRLDF
jgi:HEAT repeat protein